MRALSSICVLVAIGAVLRFWALGHQSFWFDEVVVTLVIKGSFWHVVDGVRAWESSPPLYHLIAWLWTRPVGVTEFGLRSLSALFGTATVVVVWAAAREAVSERAGVIAGALVAVNPMLVWYSQEARPYALLALLGAASVWMAIRLVRQPTRGSFAWWSVVSCLALLTHYFAAFLLAAEFVALIWLMPADRGRVAMAFLPVIAIGLALVPLAHAQDARGGNAWISAIPLGTRVGHIAKELLTANTALISSISTSSAEPYGPWWILGLLGTIGALGIGLTSAAHRRRRAPAVLAGIGVAAIVIPILLALTPLDRVNERNLIAAWPVLALALGCMLALNRRAWALVALGMILVAGLAVNVEVQRSPALQRTDWRAAADALAPTQMPRLVIVKPDYSVAVLRYYGVPLVSPPVGAKASEIVALWVAYVQPIGGLPESQPAAATTTPSATHWPGLTLRTVRAARPLTITASMLTRTRQLVLLEPSIRGLKWSSTLQALLGRWITAAKRAPADPAATTVLENAPAALRASGLKSLPPELSAVPVTLTRIRQIAARAVKLGRDPNSRNRAAFHAALAMVPSL